MLNQLQLTNLQIHILILKSFFIDLKNKIQFLQILKFSVHEVRSKGKLVLQLQPRPQSQSTP